MAHDEDETRLGCRPPDDLEAPWQEDTVCVVFSCTKAATALCAHLLANRAAQEWEDLINEGGVPAARVRSLLTQARARATCEAQSLVSQETSRQNST